MTTAGEMVPLGATGYLSLPDGATPPLPAVIAVHDRDGLTSNVKLWTDRFAAQGFAAVAVDLYDGREATDPDEAASMAEAVDPQHALSTLSQALHFVVSDRRIRAPRCAVVGWGWGGEWALRTALREPRTAAVAMYGGELTADATQLAALECPLLGLFGTAGSPQRSKALDRFEMGLEQAGSKRYRLLRYDQLPRFAQPESEHYDPATAAEAYQELLAFLQKHLGSVAN